MVAHSDRTLVVFIFDTHQRYLVCKLETLVPLISIFCPDSLLSVINGGISFYHS